ncbi:hypothetical protein BDW22DRAFT_1426961 [Trametopsis cervina]|nr:hypothetical protein BDW22DRAFT_1426961 [Trametopsis cervina]
MCSDSRDYVYRDSTTGLPLDQVAIQSMPLPDPEWGWYHESKWAISEYTVSDWGEVDAIHGIEYTLDPAVQAQKFTLPVTLWLCTLCGAVFLQTKASFVRHCNELRHRTHLSRVSGWPAVLGPSHRVPIPDSYASGSGSTMYDETEGRVLEKRSKAIDPAEREVLDAYDIKRSTGQTGTDTPSDEERDVDIDMDATMRERYGYDGLLRIMGQIDKMKL